MELKHGIDRVVNANISPAARRGLELQRAWEAIAPKKVLSHTDNVIVSKKKADSIAVFVDTPHLAASLSMSKEYYRQMLEHELECRVTDLFFVVSKATGIRKEFKKRDQETPWFQEDCEPVPLSEGELAYARASVDEIEDPELKEMLLKAFISDMEWKKGRKAQKTPQTEN